ncbi:MAG: DNA-directed RNA polymerase subunit omega [Terriglobales bacterium]
MMGPFASIEDLPSRYQFVHVVARRARKLQAGARPLKAVTSRKPTRIAQLEAMAGLLDFTYVGAGKGAKANSGDKS